MASKQAWGWIVSLEKHKFNIYQLTAAALRPIVASLLSLYWEGSVFFKRRSMFSSPKARCKLDIRLANSLWDRQVLGKLPGCLFSVYPLCFYPPCTYTNTVSHSLFHSHTVTAAVKHKECICCVTMHLSDSIHSIRLPWISKASILLFMNVHRK